MHGLSYRVIPSLFMFALAGAASATTGEAAEKLVRDTTERILTVLKNERETLKENPSRIYYLVNGILVPHFDFERMSRWVLGKYWRRATLEERERFTVEFKTLLVRTYASVLAEYADEKVSVFPVRTKGETDRVTIHTKVHQRGGGVPIAIAYRMYLKGDLWKVYDVTIDGMSLVANYRRGFATEIEREGLDMLIARLVESNARDVP